MAILTQIVICIIPVIPIAVITLIVAGDAGGKGLSGRETLAWIILSLCFFPVGLLLYFLITRKNSVRKEEGVK